MTFDDQICLAIPRHCMEEDRFFYGRYHCMPNAAEHGMIRPDREIVFMKLFQCLCIVKEMLLAVFRGYAQASGELCIEPPATSKDIFVRDQRHRRRMVSRAIHQE